MKSICFAACLAMLCFVLSCSDINSNQKDQNPESFTGSIKPLADNQTGNGTFFAADSMHTDQEPGEEQPQKEKRQQQQPVSQPTIKPDWDKKIIKTAILNAEVKDYNSFYASMREKVRNLGGYIAQEEQTQSDYKIENSVMIKVPVDKFDDAVAQLMANTEKINDKKITSQDVTTEVIDTKSRMEAKKQVRLRYMDLLKQARNMQEILSVQSEINGIQEEIESAAGRIEYLSHSSTFSTIHFTYFQVLNSSAKDIDKPSFATKLGNAFNTGWNWIGELFVGVVTLWPLVLLVFAIIVVYKRSKAKLKTVK